jgi:hypothetical protein
VSEGQKVRKKEDRQHKNKQNIDMEEKTYKDKT